MARHAVQALCAVLLMASSVARAQLTWTGAVNTTWDTTTANWSGSSTTWTGTSAVFDATAPTNKRTITVSGTQTVNTLNVSADDYVFNGGTLQASTFANWTFDNDVTINSALSGTRNLRKIGSGILTTTADITLASLTDGQIEVRGGTFRQAGGAITLGRSSEGSAALFVGNGAAGTFEATGGTLLATGTSTPGSLRVGTAVPGTLIINGGSLGFAGSGNGFNAGSDNTGTINLQTGELALNNLAVISGTAVFNFSGGTLRPYSTDAGIGSATVGANFTIGLSGTGATIAGVDLNSTPRTLDLYAILTDGGSSGGMTFSGGTVNVRATNTYTGLTTVATGGTVALLGSADSSSGFAVNGTLDVAGKTSGFTFGAAQTLSGSGAVLLPTSGPGVAVAGFLSPGNSAIGTLAFSGAGLLDLEPTISGGSGRLQFELADPGTSDLVTVSSGTLAIGLGLLGFSDFDFTPLDGFGPGSYTLFSADSLSGFLGGGTTGTVGGYDATLQQVGSTIQLVVVPEPTLPLAALGFAAAWAVARSRRRTA